MCSLCKGDLYDKLTTFTVDLDNCTIIIKNVPSQVCRQCGEISYSWDVSKRLEEIVKEAKMSIGELVILSYAA